MRFFHRVIQITAVENECIKIAYDGSWNALSVNYPILPMISTVWINYNGLLIENNSVASVIVPGVKTSRLIKIGNGINSGPLSHIDCETFADVFEKKSEGNIVLPFNISVYCHDPWCEPRTIGGNQRLVSDIGGSLRLIASAFSFSQTLINENQSDNGHRCGTCSDPVKAASNSNLPAPKLPFIGAVLFIIGAWLNYRGIVYGPFAALIGGWFISVSGGVIFLFWLIPFVAEQIPTP